MKPSKVLSTSIVTVLGLFAVVPSIANAANVWDGGGATNLWSDLANWDDDLFPTYGTLTFSGSAQTTNVVDASINMNSLFWNGTSAWTLNAANSAVISLFDNGGAQAKVENQSTGTLTVNAPISFAANNGSPANPFGEINAVNGDITFGPAAAFSVVGSSVNGIKFWGGAGRSVTFNNTVSAAGKYFSTTGSGAINIGAAASVAVGNIHVMNGGALNLSGGTLTHDANTGIRLGGDLGTGNQNLALGGTVNLTPVAGGLTYSGLINSVTGNTSGALLIDSQNTSGTNTLSGSIFLDSPLRLQVAAGGSLAVTGVVSNASSLTKQGGGTLTLSGANTFAGGTTLAAGALNLGNAAALGGGALTVSGNSTLDNTSGGAITMAAAKNINLNADLTFTGTNNINLNGGTIAVGGAAGARTLNVAGGTLSTNNLTTAAGVTLSKTGAGTLTLTSTANNATNLAGVLNIESGRVVAFSDVTLGGLSGSGTYELGGTSRWLFINGAGTSSFGGTIQNGAAALGVTKDGTGTQSVTGNMTLGSDFRLIRGSLTLSGTNTFSAPSTVGLGAAITDASRPTLNLAGGTTTVPNNQFNIGTIAGGNAILNVTAGTLNANRNGAASFAAGAGDNTRGFVTMSGGVINAVNEFWLGQSGTGNAANAYGAMTMTGGTLNGGSWIAIGRNGKGIVNMSGGTINVAANFFTTGGVAANSVGVMNLSGSGIVNVNTNAANGGYYVAETGTGILNMSGGAVNIATTAANGLNIAAGGGAGIANLNGGVFTTPIVRKSGAGSGILNFNGGTLKSSAANANFMTGLTSANIFAGGATIDSNNVAITIAQPLLAPAGNGLTSIPVATGGAGYLDTPTVVISGGGGTGATAVANISGGVITGFTITSPGTGYTSAPTVTLFGGGATTAGTPGVAAFAANATTGGLTKTGAGTLTIGSTSSSYGGATTINGGTIAIGAIANGGVASSLGASSNAAENLVLNNGTLEFTGVTGSTDRSFTLASGTTGTINVSNASGVLTVSGSSAATNGNFTKTGVGALSFTGTANHTGTTTVAAGVLGLSGTTAGPIVVNGGRLTAGYQTVGTLNTPSLTLGSSGGLDFDFGGGNDLINVTTANTGLVLGTGTTINLYNAGGAGAFSTNGTYALFDYDTAFSGALGGAFIVANSQPGKIYSIANNTGATTIDLTIGDAITSAWAVDADGLWSTGANWTNGRPNSIGATANLTAAITGPHTVTVDGPQTVGNIVFANSNAYTVTGGATDIITLNNGLGVATISATSGSHSLNAPISFVNPSAVSADAGASLIIGGDISGATELIKIGNGTVSIAGANGTTTTNVQNGILQIGAGGTTGSLGTGAVTVGLGATLAFNRSNSLSAANNIGGAGSISQIAAGTTTLSGTIAHTGTTSVSGGSLVNEGVISGTTALNVDGGSFITQATGNTTVAGATAVGATANGSLSILGGAGAAFNGIANIGSGAGVTGSMTIDTTGTVASTGIINVGIGAGGNGSFTMTNGTVNQSGATNIAIGANGGSGTFSMSAGTINTGTANPGFGVAVGTAGSTGSATVTGGTINSPGEVWIGNNGVAGAGPANNATMTMSGGALNSGSWLVVGRNTGIGTLNLSGGTITKGGAGSSYLIIGSLGGTGTVNQTGGALNATAGGLRMGENAGATPALAALWDMQGGTSTINGEVNIGWRSSEATWNIGGTANVSATGRLIVAAETANAAINAGVIVAGAPVGTVNMTGGTATFAGGDSRIGGDNSAVSVGAQGTVAVSGGTMNFGGNLQIGAYGTGTMNITGTGVVNSTGGFPVIGRYVGGTGSLNVAAGGSFVQTNATNNALIVAEQGTGTLNIFSGGLVDVQNVFVGHTTTANGTVNLAGGTLATKIVQRTETTASTAAFNFDGGTLKAKASAASFFPGFTNTQLKVESGGAIVDTNGFDIGIAQNLTAGTSLGGGLTKSGAGTLTLGGSNTYSGATIVDSGTLIVSGGISGAVTVNSGGRLGGTGSTGPVTVNSGGTIAPGLSPGQLNVGGVALASGAVLSLEIDGTSPGSFDVLNVTGNVSLAGNLSLSGNYLTTPSVTNDLFFAIINDGAEPISGIFAGLPDGAHVFASNGQDYIVSYFGDSIGGTFTGGNDFVLQAVPEPGSAILLLGGVAMLAGRRRREGR
jgi:fibronectin-binding autotransporter adhesin